MKEGPDIARIAALIGEPARANMLTALMSGRALTATELAAEAGVTAQTASTHLAQMVEAGLINPRKSGRHKYMSLARPEVAQALEALMGVAAATGHLRTRTGPKDTALRRARVCYNHLAGEVGTALYDRWLADDLLREVGDAVGLTPKGEAAFSDWGVDLAPLRNARAPLCRPCLDWSERRTHLAGSLGRAILAHMDQLGWAKRDSTSRAVHITARGEAGLARWL
ncbi:winged helix-turn-helix domain-containing protein [Gymnodinialimonas sp. 2305UL16-5]|uniref:ArsR/SmtB family transcription factor n=1 Tax=Gymnodinialimonas mytili TaxID=3126503 RepID=UPI0030960402